MTVIMLNEFEDNGELTKEEIAFLEMVARVDRGEGTQGEYNAVKMWREEALGNGTAVVSGLGDVHTTDWMDVLKP